ncbi:hypothetical protein [Membranihabitans marinus]|uniref:hypothetical protein n=1 Tax=Membranihabitans marinus TaxID=1227546 RepID=UPI001F1B89D9|nr:hypothetical protein [Membranihabitans marinus]
MKIKGKVVYVDLEGGFWGIESLDQKKYLPINMPEQLKLKGKTIEIEAILRPDIQGMTMWGEYIEIITFTTI